MPSSDTSFREFLGAPEEHCFKFFDCTPHEIETTIATLKNKKDNVEKFSTHMFKLCRRELSVPLSYLITKSFRLGQFPDSLKIAKVIPVFKSGDNKLTSNYRPISILPTLSKLFERIAYRRLYQFLSKFKVLHNSQFGFRQGRSTSDALTIILQNIHKSLEKGEIIMNIYLDLSKAFDTVDHEILLSKLNHCGVRGVELSWFENYLSGRKQSVQFDNMKSESKKVTVGVPQGSILGPLLFTVMINDIFNSVDVPIICYADDSTIIQMLHRHQSWFPG